MLEEIANDTLPAALARHELALSDNVVALLQRYCELLWDWNEKINLTRHTTYEKFVTRDVVDSLTLAQFLTPGESVLDVGTGGGVPGIILAIARPDLKVTMCESVGKKARVVAEIVKALGITAHVEAANMQAVLKKRRFDALVIRAVAPLPKLLTWLNPAQDRCGRVLIIKGPAWTEERGTARHLGLMQSWDLRKLISYPLPGTDSESVVLSLTPRP
jgi:16S rRNA (guanine527-N7)-methyltransferase